MNAHQHVQDVPRGALIGAAGAHAVREWPSRRSVESRTSPRTPRRAPAPAPLESFEARFEDAADGSIAVFDASSGQQVTTIAPGQENFIRGVLRGMFRSRKLESIGHVAPFTLAREADGRLTISDKQTGRTVDLESFGPTNTASFERVLAAGLQRR